MLPDFFHSELAYEAGMPEDRRPLRHVAAAVPSSTTMVAQNALPWSSNSEPVRVLGIVGPCPVRAPRGAAEMLLGTAPQRRGAAAHALLAAAGHGGAGGARWDGVVAKGTVRICVDGTWVAAPCPPEEMRSGAEQLDVGEPAP